MAPSSFQLPLPFAESYIDDNKRAKWCPSVPHCGHAVRCKEPHCEVGGARRWLPLLLQPCMVEELFVLAWRAALTAALACIRQPVDA